MIIIKSKHEIDIMREAAKVTGEILRNLKDFIKPGMSTMKIDDYIENFITKRGMKPAFKGLYGFPGSACISVNEEIVHGIPSKKRILKEGDIVSVDTGTIWKGYNSDAARTYGVGHISDEAESLIKTRAEAGGLGVIREYVGHGIGRNMHEDPQIPNFGKPGKGPRLVEGMVFAIEPMTSLGDYETRQLDDGWTVVTADGSLAAHYENTLVITDGEPELLTL